MEYNDFLISSPEEFALVAKEYNLKLEQEKENVENVFCSLFLLNWTYGQIARNIRNNKIKIIFKELEKNTSSDISLLSSIFKNSFKETKLPLPKNLGNFRGYLKFAIYKEIETTTELLKQFCNQKPEIKEMTFQHLETVEKLLKFL